MNWRSAMILLQLSTFGKYIGSSADITRDMCSGAHISRGTHITVTPVTSSFLCKQPTICITFGLLQPYFCHLSCMPVVYVTHYKLQRMLPI